MKQLEICWKLQDRLLECPQDRIRLRVTEETADLLIDLLQRRSDTLEEASEMLLQRTDRRQVIRWLQVKIPNLTYEAADQMLG